MAPFLKRLITPHRSHFLLLTARLFPPLCSKWLFPPYELISAAYFPLFSPYSPLKETHYPISTIFCSSICPSDSNLYKRKYCKCFFLLFILAQYSKEKCFYQSSPFLLFIFPFLAAAFSNKKGFFSIKPRLRS